MFRGFLLSFMCQTHQTSFCPNECVLAGILPRAPFQIEQSPPIYKMVDA